MVLVGCGSSSSKKDATTPDSRLVVADGPNVATPDAVVDSIPVAVDAGPLVTPDATVDNPPVAVDASPVVTPDAQVDSPSVALDTNPVVTPDATPDNRPITVDTAPPVTPDATIDNRAVTVDTAPVVTPDAAVDNRAVTADAAPVATVDAAADGSGEAGDGGAPLDDSGAGADSLPVACDLFTGGLVVSDLTLSKACSPYIISDFIEINGDAVLTIEPGAKLMFEGNVGLDVGSYTNGKLVAVGTAQDPIVFTSHADPPLPGDWRSIRLFSGTMVGTKIAYAKLDYCGADRNGCIVGDGLGAGIATFDHLAIGHVGPDANGILEYDTDSNFAITNSTFSDIAPDRYAISVQAPSFAGIGAGNTFNGGAMIEISGGIVGSTTSWVDPGTNIAVTDTLFVDGLDSPVLTLGPGMTLMFDAALEFSIGPEMGGKLVTAGTDTRHVVITSLAVSPAQGDWVGVEVWTGGAAEINYTDISFAGRDAENGGDIIVKDGNSLATLAVNNSSFTDSLGYGIYLPCADATVTPRTTVTLGPGNTYARNDMDLSLTNTQNTNVGPGLICATH
jgi:hypothetical protein